MTRVIWLTAIAAVLLVSAHPIAAQQTSVLCIYGGELFAKTTLEQEFRDSQLVVKGEVVSSEDIDHPYPGVFYRIKITQIFKGNPAATLVDYSPRDSSGFYLKTRTEFLLFLNPIDRADSVIYLGPWAPNFPGTMMVNYSCGQSRPWAKVPEADRKRLNALSTGR